MTDAVPRASVPRRFFASPRRLAEQEVRRFRTMAALFVAGTAVALGFAGPDVRAVLGPAWVATAAALLYFTVQIRRDGQLPLFEAATFFVAAATIYTVFPLLQFVLAGLTFWPESDNRLYQYQPTPQEIGGFAWRHVTLIVTFVLVYLPVRGRRLWPIRTPARPMRTTSRVIGIAVVAIALYFVAMRIYLGPGVSAYRGGTNATLRSVPYVVLQVSNVFQLISLTLKQCLIVLLLLGWERRACRVALVVWIAADLALTLYTMESRASSMLLLLTVAVGYHRFVRPLRVKVALLSGAAVLSAFLVFGLLRDMRADPVPHEPQERHAVWGAATEFQILYGTAYDIYMRKMMGTLPPIPPQMYYSDFYRLIPSQLLPFYKWDPSEWYLEVLGLRGTGQGYMFGVIAQSVIGFGYAELVVRAFLLALFYAVAHRMYRRYSASYWTTIGYLFILSWTYYAFRSTSFDIFYRLAYYFLPAWLLVKVLTVVITRVKAVRRGAYA